LEVLVGALVDPAAAAALAGARADRVVEHTVIGADRLAHAEAEGRAVDPAEVGAVALLVAVDHTVPADRVVAGRGVEAAPRAARQLARQEAERRAVHAVEVAPVALLAGIEHSVPAARAVLLAGRAL